MTAPNELSFLPDDYLEQKGKRRANIVCAILVVLVAGGMSAAAYYVRNYDRVIQARYDEVDAKYTDAARKIEQVKKMHEQQRQVVQHAELAASLVEKIPRSNLLAEVTNSLPPGVSLLELAMDSKPHQDPPPTATSSFEQHRAQLEKANDALGMGARPPQYDVHLKVTGIAQNDGQVAQLISRLSHSKIFLDVNLVISDVYEPRRENAANNDAKPEALRKWTIEMMLNPNAEVNDTKSAAVELSK
jgi:Tfp pilus assembly protein PilN